MRLLCSSQLVHSRVRMRPVLVSPWPASDAAAAASTTTGSMNDLWIALIASIVGLSTLVIIIVVAADLFED